MDKTWKRVYYATKLSLIFDFQNKGCQKQWTNAGDNFCSQDFITGTNNA